MNDNQLPVLDDQIFQLMKETSGFDLSPCSVSLDFEDKTRFIKMELSSAQKMHISNFLQQAPTAAAAATLAQAYTVKFPEGLPHTLTALKQGGFGSMIRDNGKFVGSASFYETASQAAILSAFSAMSVVTGQYFLTQINSELNLVNQKMDKILEFLYGDKKAELLAEISFAQYAYQNYASIMTHDQQRVATLISLQEAKKVAMKDIEFYMSDLDSTVNGEAKQRQDLNNLAQTAYQIRESLNLSMQLYIMSSALEIYYAQNHDQAYLESVKATSSAYIDKCEKRMLNGLSILNRRFVDFKASAMDKVNVFDKTTKTEKSIHERHLAEMIEVLRSGEESPMHKTLNAALTTGTQEAEYYLTPDGSMYMRAN